MSRNVLVLNVVLLIALAGVCACPKIDPQTGEPIENQSGAESLTPDASPREIPLGQDDGVPWTEVTLCAADDLLAYDMVMGQGQAEGYASLVDDQGNRLPHMNYEISAPWDTQSFAMKMCGLQTKFVVVPDPSLDPSVIQAALGSVSVAVEHTGYVGDSRNYQLSIVLSVSGGAEKVTYEAEVIYCLSDEFVYCWWNTPQMDVCRYEGAGCNDPWRAGPDRLVVSDIPLEAGQTYTVELQISGWISAIEGQPEQGGRVEFELFDIGEPQVVFGLSPWVSTGAAE
jgi:hypothetical protein